MYLLMANAHRYAIDYIEQAPVIVLAATRGNAHVSWSERAFVQEQLSSMCESGAQLRDVMRAYGLPLPLRLTRRQGANRNPGDGHQAARADEPIDARPDHPCDAAEAECLAAGPRQLV